jgi:hypothetical protein
MSVIQYDHATHTYWFNGIRYVSSTQAVDIYSPEFNVEEHAPRYAEKAGRDAEYWKQTWQQKNANSLVRGNNKHDLYEQIASHRASDMVHGRPFKVQNTQMFPAHWELSDYPDGLYLEEITYSHQYLIAGRVDRFAIETIGADRYVHIEDYKTNKRLRTHSYRNPDGSYQMMKAPISHLMDCEMVHYTLQLSEYMLMFEYHGFKPGRMGLIHFPHIPEMAPAGAPEPAPVRYPIEYWKQDVVSMLNHLKTRRHEYMLQRKSSIGDNH